MWGIDPLIAPRSDVYDTLPHKDNDLKCDSQAIEASGTQSCNY